MWMRRLPLTELARENTNPSATPPTAVGGVPLPAGGDRGEVAGARNRSFRDPSTADGSGRFSSPFTHSGGPGRFSPPRA
jgi:hypothetical protein